MILQTIEAINARITEQLDTELLQVAGISVPFQDQQNNNVGLKLSDTGKRFDMDSKLKWQSTHLSDGSRIAESETFGSFTDNIYDARFILIGVSKSKAGHDLAMRAIDGVGYAVVDGYETETLNVLQRYFRVRAGQEKNYDPSLHAFAIRYHIEGVTDEDFAEMPSEEDLALLPVIVPEPEPVTVNPTPGTGFGERIINETPFGLVNGANATFLVSTDFVPESVEVFISGFRLTLLSDFNTSGLRTIQLFASPLPGEFVRINYTKPQ